MSKSQAALNHLWPSTLLLATIGSVLVFVWYPDAFLQFGDSGLFSLALIAVAVLIGPALTWLVYKKGKRGLVLDIIVIVLIQTVAIAWGTVALYQNRPYFMVFTVDRFEVLSKRQVDFSVVSQEIILGKPLRGPIVLYAIMPTNQKAYQKLVQEIMLEGKPDLQFRPEFWRLYSEKQQLATRKSRPLSLLRSARPKSEKDIDKLVQNNGGDINHLSFVPAMGQNGQFTVVLNATSGKLVDTLKVDPWVN